MALQGALTGSQLNDFLRETILLHVGHSPAALPYLG